MNILKNDPNLAGRPAMSPEFFGENDRYSVYPIHTRFDKVEWIVVDYLISDEMGLPSVIRQADTYDLAMTNF